MVGEQQKAHQAIISYMSAQLQSCMVTMTATLQANDPELYLLSAKKYLEVAGMAQQLYSDVSFAQSPSLKSNHNWRAILENLRKTPDLEISRERRLPRVTGDATDQMAILGDIISLIPSKKIIIKFRQRGDDLVVHLQGDGKMPKSLVFAGSRNVLLATAKEPSITTIRGYLLARRCSISGIGINVVKANVYLHFMVMRQLRIPL